MSKVLYMGLSDNIRGIAELFAKNGQLCGFVKPGEQKTRVTLVQQHLARSPADLILMAEAPKIQLLFPTYLSMTKRLRETGIDLPILCITNLMNERFHEEFMRAGGDVLLPFFRKNAQGHFTVGAGYLSTQIARLTGQKPETLIDEPTENGTRTGLLTLDFATKQLTIINRTVSLPACEFRVVYALSNSTKEMSSDAMIRDFNCADNKQALRLTVHRINKRVRELFADINPDEKFQLIENVGKKGWKISEDNMRYLILLEQGVELTSVHISMQEAPAQPSKVVDDFLGIKIEVVAQKAYFLERSLKVTPTGVRIFGLLASAQGEIVSRDQIYTHCRSGTTTAQEESIPKFVSDLARALRDQIPKIAQAKKVDNVPLPYIENIRGQGWRLAAYRQ